MPPQPTWPITWQRKGLPFRDAHEVVAHAVKHALQHGVDLSELPLRDAPRLSTPPSAKTSMRCSRLRGSLNARKRWAAPRLPKCARSWQDTAPDYADAYFFQPRPLQLIVEKATVRQ